MNVLNDYMNHVNIIYNINEKFDISILMYKYVLENKKSITNKYAIILIKTHMINIYNATLYNYQKKIIIKYYESIFNEAF